MYSLLLHAHGSLLDLRPNMFSLSKLSPESGYALKSLNAERPQGIFIYVNYTVHSLMKTGLT